MKKTAVILFNLGGPDTKESIKPFLFNFFIDWNIIRLPYPLRWCIAKLISVRRSKKEAGQSYSFLGHGSPLLENTQKQAEALEKKLNENTEEAGFKTFIAMRYWHPLSIETAENVKKYDPDHIVLLPLYPQYSTTTTRSSLQAWARAAKRKGITTPTSLICCYPQDAGFVKASARLLKDVFEDVRIKAVAKGCPPPRILLSAHGLPESVIKDGDPYQWQCEESAKAIIREAGLKEQDWLVSYQSKVGPAKWIGPATEEEIERAGEEGVPLVIYPHAFVNEHVETLVELDIEYKELAEEAGVPLYSRVPTVGEDDEFITGLATLVKERLDDEKIMSGEKKRICPQTCRRCSMQEYKTVKAAA